MPRSKQKLLAAQQAAAKLIKMKLRKDDVVKVISGRDKGKTGRILEVDRLRQRAVVEGVMIVKKHKRADPKQQVKGGIAESEGSIAISNLMLLAPDGKPTRVGYKVEGVGASVRRIRIARRTGEAVEKGGGK